MKPSQTPALRVEDYTDQKDWIGKLFISLNSFIQNVTQILNQNIDYSTNITAVTQSYSITAFQAFDLPWPYATAPADVRVISANKSGLQTPAILACAWVYNASKKSISIPQMIDLTGGTVAALSGSYVFTVRATI